MDAVKFLKEYGRLCNSYFYDNLGDKCTGCPFEINDFCCYVEDMATKPEKAVEIVKQWSEEHPVETYKSDFLKKFPKVVRKENGMPLVGWCDIHNGGNCLYVFEEDRDCDDCWDMEVDT